jgi:hypothetical protein
VLAPAGGRATTRHRSPRTETSARFCPSQRSMMAEQPAILLATFVAVAGWAQFAGGPAGGHCAGYTGTPPPPLGPPGPWRPYFQHFSAGMGGGGAGFGSQVGHGGDGSIGAALTGAVPPVIAAIPTPIAIRAAAAKRLTSICCPPSYSPRGLSDNWAATATVSPSRNVEHFYSIHSEHVAPWTEVQPLAR